MTQIYGGRGKTFFGFTKFHDDDLYGSDAVINYCNGMTYHREEMTKYALWIIFIVSCVFVVGLLLT